MLVFWTPWPLTGVCCLFYSCFQLFFLLSYYSFVKARRRTCVYFLAFPLSVIGRFQRLLVTLS